MNSMEQMSKKFTGYCDNNNFGKFDIRSEIKFQQPIVMSMIDIPSKSKK